MYISFCLTFDPYFHVAAAVDSGRALTALALFVHDYEDLTTPRRQLLGTPKYGKMVKAHRWKGGGVTRNVFLSV